MSSKQKVLEPVVYSRKSWSYRRWLAYHNGKESEPRNSCAYRSVVYVKMTVRQLTAPVRTLTALFKRESTASSPKPAPRPKPVVISHAEKPPLVLRVLWTGLWPVRKLTRLVFVGLFRTCEAVDDFNNRHNDILATIFAGLLVVTFAAAIVGVSVLIALDNIRMLLILLGSLVGIVAVTRGLWWFSGSDFATAIGDFFISVYYQVCRTTKFKD